MKLNVLPHGAYRPLDTPEYEAEFAKRAHNAQTGEFTLDKPIQNSSNPLRTIFLKLPKHQKVSEKPSSVGELSRAYPNALVFAKPKALIGGMMAFLPAMALGAGFGLYWILGFFLEMLISGKLSWPLLIWVGILISICIVGLSTISLWMLFVIRFTLFNHLDNPVIFDRKHRKVYRVFRPMPMPLEYVKHVFKHWNPFYAWPEVTAVEQDWDCMQAEYTRQFQVLGSQTPSMQHGLQLLVRETPDPNSKVIDGFSLVGPMNEETVMRHWEYIRQFMEEQGPALPEGEKLADNSPLRSPLDALIRMTKGIGVFMWMCHVIALAWVIFGAPLAWDEAYLLLPKNWGDGTLNYLLYHGFFLALPGFFYSWAFFSWLAQLTSIKVEWPSEIQQRLGAPTMGGGY